MPGLLDDQRKQPVAGDGLPRKTVCPCPDCPCRRSCYKSDDRTAAGKKDGLVFHLPRYRQPVSDTYTHSTYRREMCNNTLMKQHLAMAQKRAAPVPKRASFPLVRPEPFTAKTTAEADFRRPGRQVAAAACRGRRLRAKVEDDGFRFRPGEYACEEPMGRVSMSHEQFCPKKPIPSRSAVVKQVEVAMPPFEGVSCYRRDFRPPPKDAYPSKRNQKKKAAYN